MMHPLVIHPAHAFNDFIHSKKVTSFQKQHSDLEKILASIIDPFLAFPEIVLHPSKISYVMLKPHHGAMVSRMVNWSYNYWYNPTGYKPLLKCDTIQGENRVFGALYHGSDIPILLMTFSITKYSNVEFTELFLDHHEIVAHATATDFSVELKRFARNPLFDALKLGSMKSQAKSLERHIFHNLWVAMSQYMAENNLTPFYILAPHVSRWFSKAGVPPVCEVATKLNIDGALYQQLRRHFPTYWSANPILYKAPIVLQ